MKQNHFLHRMSLAIAGLGVLGILVTVLRSAMYILGERELLSISVVTAAALALGITIILMILAVLSLRFLGTMQLGYKTLKGILLAVIVCCIIDGARIVFFLVGEFSATQIPTTFESVGLKNMIAFICALGVPAELRRHSHQT